MWKRIGLMRAITKGRRYGLSKPRSFSAAIAAATASSSSSSAAARSSRIASAFDSGFSENPSSRFSRA